MKPTPLPAALFEWLAIVCAFTVFIAAALDAPDDASPRKPIPVAAAERGA